MAGRSIRGRAYTAIEDTTLCQSWIAITQDPLIGNDQSGAQFWDRVCATFVTLLNIPTDRTSCSLSNRFSIIAKEVALFIAKLGHVINRAASGSTEADKFREARQDYMHSTGKSFRFEECYELLKDQPKFSLRTTQVFDSILSSQFPGIATPRLPTPPNWESDIPTDDADSPSPIPRPPGRKAEKKKGKRVAESSQLALMVEETKNFNSFYREAEERRLHTMEKKLEIRQKDHELKERLEEDRIMTLDLSILNETQRMYFMFRQKEIMQKRGYQS